MLTTDNTVIGFVGIGVMGKSMANHLIDAGYKVLIYTRTKEKATDLLIKGAEWVNSPREMAKAANVVITMVGYPHDVEEVYFGENGLIPHSKPNSYFIDMTTSQPALAERIYDECKKRHVNALDCPVSGGDIGARDAKLAIMVGGDEEAFAQVKHILEIIGSNIVYQGKAGAGQHAKMCNQIVVASTMIGVSEAVAYAEKAQLDPETVLKSVSTGAASSWLLSNLGPKMIEKDFEPGFYIKHFLKDMKIAIEEAERLEMEIPGVRLAKELYEKVASEGEENSGTQALYKYWK